MAPTEHNEQRVLAKWCDHGQRGELDTFAAKIPYGMFPEISFPRIWIFSKDAEEVQLSGYGILECSG